MTEEALDEFYGALLDDDPEALYDRAPCGYLSTTPDGTILKVNRTFLTLTGYGRAELVGQRTFADLLTPGGRIYHETHYTPMLQMQGAAREIALDLVCADGRRLPTLVNSVLERDHHDAPVVVRTAVFDATNRREYERELLRAKQQAEESEQRANELARTLQQTLIPPEPPQIPGLDVAAIYRPAGDGGEVGGDFYDVFQLDDDDWIVVIGDVCGKGAEAAVVTSLTRHAIRAAAVRADRVSEILHTLNDVLLRHENDRFCTVAIVRLLRASDGWTATVCCGGHPLPLLLRPPAAVEPVGQHGSLVGVFPTATFHDTAVPLRPHDTLVLYTDGVDEGRRGQDFFGIERLRNEVRAHDGTAGELAHRLLDAVLAFQDDQPRDDIAIVTITVS
jgi:sigma-B regulation protein RsbU (phosphoserine phosphatase)